MSVTAAEMQALVIAIEHASADPATLAALFRDQRITTGPTRITQRRTPTMPVPGAHLTPPALAPALQRSAA